MITVGRREWCGLPALGVPAIKVKVDTGARTSSLHASEIEQEHRDGVGWVRFRVAPLREHSGFLLTCEAPISSVRRVRSSNGQIQQRVFIETTLLLGRESWDIEVSLADRSDMKFPMLLGRQAMRGRVHVNPGASYLTGRKAPHQYREHGLPKRGRQ